ncbi:MAG: YceI family protein [Thermoplasmatales archaeon]|jgi:polyisoprenoid-binding protein YceI|nr:YceI family protein [Thermoplasmatales archaeon]
MQPSENGNKWTIDKAHSNLEFVVRHMMISNVRGRFRSFGGDVRLDLNDIGKSIVKLDIDSGSIFTNEDDRDKHLKSQDFLHVEKYPLIKFESTEVEKSGDKVNIKGKLIIRDVSRDVSVSGELQGPISDPYGKKRIGFDGGATIARKDFGLTWNMVLEGGGILVGDSVKIEIHMELTAD